MDREKHNEATWMPRDLTVGKSMMPVQRSEESIQIPNASLFGGDTASYLLGKLRGESIIVTPQVKNDENDIINDPHEEGFNTVAVTVLDDTRRTSTAGGVDKHLKDQDNCNDES
ncbi:ammonium transporter [Trypanosoma grayi]|uniref:ammonium transporter n=1 Tax=Trypanosoma grayi TaxID=71804 RepID=UPI0004F41D9C|nr:ammonium transporter [Trypanosoma grayi]KEG09093.1 ammonium transporter [Trypanosoma grayi]